MKLIIPLIAAFSLAPVVLIAAELGDTSKASATDEITDEGGSDEEDEEERRQRLNLESGAE